ncbi:MAG: XdhC family protein [Bacteroidota bacterium]|nr:XdhC family protein [Bacteroidota bacterium]
MTTLKTWKLMRESLQNKLAVMLLYVLESSGSSPGRQGFFMAVNINGEMEGSIGGGIMEHKFVEMARERLLALSNEPLAADIKKQFHDKVAAKNQSGMICSGEQTILLYRLQEKDIVPVQHIIRSIEQYKNGTLTLSPDGIRFNDAMPEMNFEFTFQSEDSWIYKEKTGYKNQLFIIGGGHCALSLSRLMRSMDFFIRVYDERKKLKTMLENNAAHEKYFINDYYSLKEMIPPGKDHYVVIMTFGYRTDDIALRALLGKGFKYLGLLGSKTKTGKMLKDYRKEGIPGEKLQCIHTPIGLAVKSQTPEEIAVSIAAEIIKVKNEFL